MARERARWRGWRSTSWPTWSSERGLPPAHARGLPHRPAQLRASSRSRRTSARQAGPPTSPTSWQVEPAPPERGRPPRRPRRSTQSRLPTPSPPPCAAKALRGGPATLAPPRRGASSHVHPRRDRAPVEDPPAPDPRRSATAPCSSSCTPAGCARRRRSAELGDVDLEQHVWRPRQGVEGAPPRSAEAGPRASRPTWSAAARVRAGSSPRRPVPELPRRPLTRQGLCLQDRRRHAPTAGSPTA